MWLTCAEIAKPSRVCFAQTDLTLNKYHLATETCFGQTFVCEHCLTAGNNTQQAHKRSVEARCMCAVAVACDIVTKGWRL